MIANIFTPCYLHTICQNASYKLLKQLYRQYYELSLSSETAKCHHCRTEENL